MSTPQASQPPQAPQSTPGIGTFLSDAVSLLQDDPKIVAVTVVGGLLTAVPIVGTFLNIAVVGFAHVLAQQALGRRVTQQESLAMRILYLILASIVAGIAVLIGLVFLVLPGLYLLARFALLTPAIMIDGHGPIDGISESWDRTSGNVLTVLGVVVVLFVAAIVITAPVTLVLGIGVTGQAVAGLLTGVITAVSVGAFVLMYGSFRGGQPQGGYGQPHQGGQGQYQGGQGQYQGGQQQQQYQGGQQQGGHQQGGRQQGGQQQGGHQQGGRQRGGRQQGNDRNQRGGNQQNDHQSDDQW